MSQTVLVTGFEPFAGASLNPSQRVIQQLTNMSFNEVNLICEVLPVEFESATTALLNLIAHHKPNIVISLGQAEGRSSISIERIAINLADARIADNSGTQLTDQKIDPTGEPSYFSTLPVMKLVELLNAAGIKSSQSLSAGSFVCNYIFYQMQAALTNQGVLSGFIHLPLVPEQQAEFPGQPTMPLSEMVAGIELIIKQLAKTT